MTNRLINEDSLYLRQHANNPIDWYGWGDDAIKKAKDENKPIFLSIGYSSCHWCHKMNREVFNNKELANILNKNFISIKVDKEERVDLDNYFQKIHYILNNKTGGWPTSIFLTPELKPFFATTYIPPQTEHGLVGFGEILNLINNKFKNENHEIVNITNQIDKILKDENENTKAVKIDSKMVPRTIEHATMLFDKKNGGFSKAPKFPRVSTIDILLDCYEISQSLTAKHMITTTLDAMTKGGLYDIIDGGFCRYSTDEKWLIPHFEKMMYDNALLATLYLRAGEILNDNNYVNIGLKTVEFITNFMSKDGLFYTSSNADSINEEGGYFIYDYNEVIDIFTKNGFNQQEIEDACEFLSITKDGNFNKKSIIRAILKTYPEIANRAIEILKDIRKKREYPLIDKKIITSYNAMAIKALFVASKIDIKWLEIAKSSLSKLLKIVVIDNKLYHCNFIDKIPKIEAFLEDYAYLADTLLKAYERTTNQEYLTTAQHYANKALEYFYENGKWYFSNKEFRTIASTDDSSYPSASAIITKVLFDLSNLVDKKYLEFVNKSIEYNSINIMKYPAYNGAFTKVTIQQMKSV